MSHDNSSGISAWQDEPATEHFCGYSGSEEETRQGAGVKGTQSKTLNLEIRHWRENNWEAPVKNSVSYPDRWAKKGFFRVGKPPPTSVLTCRAAQFWGSSPGVRVRLSRLKGALPTRQASLTHQPHLSGLQATRTSDRLLSDPEGSHRFLSLGCCNKNTINWVAQTTFISHNS